MWPVDDNGPSADTGRPSGPFQRRARDPRSCGSRHRRRRRRRPAGRRPGSGRPRRGPGQVRRRAGARLLRLDPEGRRDAQPVRGGAREHREPGRRDLGGPRRRRHDVQHRAVRQQGEGLPGLRRPARARQPGDGRQAVRLPALRGRRVSQGPRPRPGQGDRHRHQLRGRHGAGRQAPPGRRGPARDDPVHGRQARRQGRAAQPGPGRARPAVRQADAVRVAAGRDGPGGQGPTGARGRARPDADHQGHAGLRQRGDVRLAAGRLPVARPGRQRRRCRAPGRDLHVHGRATADRDAGAATGRAGRRPGDPGPPARRPDRPGLGAAGRAGPARRRLPGAVRRGRRRLHRFDRGRLDQDDCHCPWACRRRPTTAARSPPSVPTGRDPGPRPRRRRWFRRLPPPSRPSVRSIARSR